MMNQPEISLVICTYNRSDYIEDTLRSLIQNDIDSSRFEILVIDNNSADNTQEIVLRFIKENQEFKIHYYKEEKQGLSHARNRGIKEANASIILFLDDDVIADACLIKNWLTFFNDFPDAAGGGGKIEIQFDSPKPDWMSHFLMPLLAQHDLGNKLKEYRWGKYPVGANMAFRKSAFEKYGLFKTNLGRKGDQLTANEEKEFYLRAKLQNAEFYYIPAAFLYHRVGRQRLTIEYVKKQALGLGRSTAMQLEYAGWKSKLQKFISEFLKAAVTFVLFVFYSLGFQYPKAKMLVKFRWWIWKGYLEFRRV